MMGGAKCSLARRKILTVTGIGVRVAGWSTLEIAGHACQAYAPSRLSSYGYTLLYLHDHQADELSGRPAFESLLEQHGLRCLAPDTGRSWWTDRIWPPFDDLLTAEAYIADRVLPWLDADWSARPPGIALLGIGMGGQGALRLSYKRPNAFPIVAAISPEIDCHLEMEQGDKTLQALYRDPEQARQDTATLHIHPLNWPRHQWFACDPLDYQWYDSADRLRMKLYSLGVPYEADLESSGGGHSWPYFERMAGPAIQFIIDRLERERLRASGGPLDARNWGDRKQQPGGRRL
jgi:hypothetical protein